MGFDAAGNFSRAYNYTQDRDNGIKILASHVDGEFDNFATAMNLVFFRDGRVPMSADLRLNINGIQGLKDGALGSPAIKFNTDANTGPYLDGLSRYAIGVNAVQRGVFTTTGFDVTGVLSQGGLQVATLASPAFTGVPTAPTAAGGTNTTQLATTAYVMNAVAGYLPLTGGTISGTLTSNGFFTAASGMNVGNNVAAGTSVYLNSASGNVRTFGFLTAGVYAADIALQTDNGTIKHNANNAHRFDVGGAQSLTVASSTTTYINGSKLLLQHDGTDGYIRADTGKLHLGAGGVNVLQVLSTGVVNVLPAASFVQNQGAGGSYTVGFSNQRNGGGRVGYHMYNGGGVTEWIVYQPTPATGHEFRIASGASGGLSDQFTINSAGAFTFAGAGNVIGTMQSDDYTTVRRASTSTGAMFFGNSGTRYIYWDGTNFNLNGPLVVAGNITSTSDARLKSDVRPLGNARQLVSQLSGKRFNMYGKPDVGLIAQDVQRVLPELIRTDAQGMLSLDYGRLVAVLIEDNNGLAARLDRAGL